MNGLWSVNNPAYLNPNSVNFIFRAEIQFENSGGADCNCCVAQQWIKGKVSKNGQPSLKASNGNLLDGTWQRDTVKDVDPSACTYVIVDTPGWRNGMVTGDTIDLDYTIEYRVIDICNQEVVWKSTPAHVTAKGTYPNNIKFTPTPGAK